jgi:hypothetical protein
VRDGALGVDYSGRLTGVMSCADLMLSADVGRIPIVERGSGKLVGLVARKDLLRLRSALTSSESERRPYLGMRPEKAG